MSMIASERPLSANGSIRPTPSSGPIKPATIASSQTLPQQTNLLQSEGIEVYDHAANPNQNNTSDPWKEKLVLTFDGGGIRGYSSLRLLEALMKEIARIERISDPPYSNSFAPGPKPEDVSTTLRTAATAPSPSAPGLLSSRRVRRAATDQQAAVQSVDQGAMSQDSTGAEALGEYLPCHYFDYIFGTSTGGLISIMLGRFRMNVPECLEQYEVMGERVFGSPRSFSFKGWPKNKFNKRNLEACIKELTAKHVPKDCNIEDFDRFPYPDDLCRTAVLTYKVSRSPGDENGRTILRSYDNELVSGRKLGLAPLSPGKANNFQIWESARATSAAQFIFQEITIDKEIYVDGAFTDPNPVTEARQELISKDRNSPTKLCLSIGTGKSPIGKSTAKRPGLVKIYRTISLVRSKALDCERAHIEAERIFAQSDVPYYRLNTGIKVGKTRTGEWEQKRKSDGLTTLQYLTKETKEDLKNLEMKRQITECAQKLVDCRRRRARDLARWERFAMCTTYTCKICKAPSFRLSDELNAHLKDKHASFYRDNQPGLKQYLASRQTKPKHPRGPW